MLTLVQGHLNQRLCIQFTRKKYILIRVNQNSPSEILFLISIYVYKKNKRWLNVQPNINEVHVGFHIGLTKVCPQIK